MNNWDMKTLISLISYKRMCEREGEEEEGRAGKKKCNDEMGVWIVEWGCSTLSLATAPQE